MTARRKPDHGPKAEAPVSVRLERSLLQAIRSQARRLGKPTSRVIKELLEMALNMQRFPGVVFVEGPAGRRAHLAGTGLDVWEIIALLREFGSASSLREHFPRLSPIAITVAEAYARANPDEIKYFLELNARSADDLKRTLPWLETVRG